MQGFFCPSSIFFTSRQCFGTDPSVREGLWSLGSEQFVYVSGRNAIFFSEHLDEADDRAQVFMPTTDKARTIRALTASPNKRWVALAEDGPRPTILVYYDLGVPLRRFKPIQPPGAAGAQTGATPDSLTERPSIPGLFGAGRTFVALALSRDLTADSRYLAAVLHPDSRLLLWQLDVSKNAVKLLAEDALPDLRTVPVAAATPSTSASLAASVGGAGAGAGSAVAGGASGSPQGSIVQVQFSPQDASQLSVLGPRFFRFYQWREGALKAKEPLAKVTGREGQGFGKVARRAV